MAFLSNSLVKPDVHSPLNPAPGYLSKSSLYQPELTTSHLRWVKYYLVHHFQIEDFSRFEAIKTENFPVIHSDFFAPHNNPNLRFRIEVYPKGDCEAAKGYFSVYLFFYSSEVKEICLRFKFSLMDHLGMKHNTLVTQTKLHCERGWGWTRYVTSHYVHDNGLLSQDQLNIICELEVLSDHFYHYSIQKSHGFNLYGCQLESTQTLVDSFLKLFKTGQFSDVTIVITNFKEGPEMYKKFLAHKLILSSRSTVFEAMLENENCIEVRNVSFVVFEHFLIYLYTGNVIDSLPMYAKELLELSDKYCVDSLKSMCTQQLANQLSTENVVDKFHLAERHSAPELERACMKYITQNSTDVMLSDGWEDFYKSHPQMINMFRDLSL